MRAPGRTITCTTFFAAQQSLQPLLTAPVCRPAGREAHPPAERDPLSDEDEPQVVDDGEGAREEPMMYEDLRAAFPMDFGEL